MIETYILRPIIRLATRCVAWLSKAIRWLTVRMEKVTKWLNSDATAADNGDGTHSHHVRFTDAKVAYILLNDQMLDEDEWAERVSNSAATSPFVVLDEKAKS